MTKISNEVTREDIDLILSMPDGSVTDTELLRKIGLITTITAPILTKDEVISICRKPDPLRTFACLYPHIQVAYDILPEQPKKRIQIGGKDVHSPEGMELIIRRFVNHCDIHGYPSTSFKKKVKKFLRSKNNNSN